MSIPNSKNRAGHEYPQHPTDGRRRVYFVKPVGMDGPIKIGCSLHPRARMSSFATWSPFPLELVAEIPGDLELETAIHDCFADCFSHREWFHPSPRLLKFIEDIRAGAPLSAAIDLTDRKGSVRSLRRRDAMARKGTASETYSL